MLLGWHTLALAGRCSATGRVAQLVRALVSHTRGPGFESLRDHTETPPPVAFFVPLYAEHMSPSRIP